jgi:D-alanyl-D-alanine carboxypeptidase
LTVQVGNSALIEAKHWVRSGVVGLLVAIFLTAFAGSPAGAKYASMVMDADTGKILHAVNADTRNYPASLTKIMTLYMVFSALDGGRLALHQRMKVSARAARQPPSKLALRAGGTISVEEAIFALVTKSANDVAVVIAENLGGTERKFGLMMTAKARKIGMSRTTFRNASGLPHRGQMSTARDMAKLGRALITKFPHHYHYFSTLSFTYDGLKHRNHNKLLTTYNGTDGIKTGYIHASGFNLVASVKRGKHRLIGVVFGGRTSAQRNRLMAKLLDKGFRRLNPTTQVAQTQTRKKPRKKTPTGRWGIQVGAYASYAPALEIARKAVAKVPRYLKNGIVKVIPLKKRNRRPLYRGRILGISKKEAYRACRALKKYKISCMALRLKASVQLASAAD